MTEQTKAKTAILATLLFPTFDWALAISSPPIQTPYKVCSPTTAKKIKIQSSTGLAISMFDFQLYSDGINIASDGTASQSSTWKTKFASLAVDHDNSTFSHTGDGDTSPWWELDLNKTQFLDSISVLNRWCVSSDDPNDCLCRLSDATLSLLDDSGAIVSTFDLGDTCNTPEIELDLVTCVDKCSPNVSRVKVESTTGVAVSMFEMQLFENGMNIAGNGIATQSSDYTTKFASLAIDGDTSTFSHTGDGDASPWFELDLNGVHVIDHLTIMNRWCKSSDDPNSCLCRLSNSKVSFMDESGTVVSTQSFGDTCGVYELDVDLATCVEESLSPSLSPTVKPATSSPTQTTVTKTECLLAAKKVKLESTTGLSVSMFEMQLFSEGVNIAGNGIASQSSDYSTKFAPLAVDGDSSTFSHTDFNDDNAWWELELNGVHVIDHLTIVNRWCKSSDDPNGCLCRLSNARLSFMDESGTVISTQSFGDTCGVFELDVDLATCGEPVTPSPTTALTASPTTECSLHAKKVKLESTTGLSVSMFEMQLFSAGVNIAGNGIASQSSDYSTKFASLAVDGDGSTFSHTDFNDDNAWWELDLTEMHALDHLTIMNRWCKSSDDPNGCLCRLSNSKVSFMDESGAVVSTQSFGDTCGVYEMDLELSSCVETSSPSPSPTSNPVTPSPTTALTASPTTECSLHAKKVKLESTTGLSVSMFEMQLFSAGVNIAGNGIASQSSDYSTKFAPLAVDGDSSTFSHTDFNDDNAWWELDLNEMQALDHLTIVNRWCKSSDDPNGCLCRLSNARLSFMDESGTVVSTQSFGDTCGVYELDVDLATCVVTDSTSSPTSSPTTSKPITVSPTAAPTSSPSADSCSIDARRVKIESTSGMPIAMFEMQAISDGVNVALDGIASQSSTLRSLSASNANDNDETTYSHTNDSTSWWEIDLAESHLLDSLTIANRWCGDSSDPIGCYCRLSSSLITISNEDGAVVWTQYLGDTCGVSQLELSLTSSPCKLFSAVPSSHPTSAPTKGPSGAPTLRPITSRPSAAPSKSTTMEPTISPTMESATMDPTNEPTTSPTFSPTLKPSMSPTTSPTMEPTMSPSFSPTLSPSMSPTLKPVTSSPSTSPSSYPSEMQTNSPSMAPSATHTSLPSSSPSSALNSPAPTIVNNGNQAPSFPTTPMAPTNSPTTSFQPSFSPSLRPTMRPTRGPTARPTMVPTSSGSRPSGALLTAISAVVTLYLFL